MHADSNVRRWGSVPGIKWLGFMELDFHDALNCCLNDVIFTYVDTYAFVEGGELDVT